MSYAVIAVGGKQYVVREGERLLVDRLQQDEGATFKPEVLLATTDGAPNLAPTNVAVTARVVRHTLGDKIRIGKYKAKKGYRKQTGFRASLSQIEIETIGAVGAPAKKAKSARAVAEPRAEVAKPAAKPVASPAAVKPVAKPAAPKAPAAKASAKPAAKKPAATKAAVQKAPAKATSEGAKKPAPKRAATRKKAEE
jgi:large subunit ribosomal protein L21